MPVRQAEQQAVTTKKTATFKEFEKIGSQIPGFMESIKDYKELDVQGDDSKVPILYVQFHPDPERPDWQIKEFLFKWHQFSVVGTPNYVVEVVPEKKLNQFLLAYHKI